MSFTHMRRSVGAAVLTGAMLIGTGGSAAADEVRDAQWPLEAFIAADIWKMSTGKGVTVAVIDEGFDRSHPDLKGRFLPGTDVTGGKWKNLDPNDGVVDRRDHGTAMASIIAARGHGPGGSKGLKGLAPDVRILPVKTQISGRPEGNQFYHAIRYAVDHGAKVISMSFAGSADGDTPKAIQYALERNVVLVAGVGNDGLPKDQYPAAYPGVIGVGAVDKYGKVWDGSNYNSSVDLLAPGVDVPNAAVGKGIRYQVDGEGTSLSTAYVAAAAALVRAKFPDLTAGQVANRLVKTAGLPDDMKNAKLPDEHYGYGYIQPRAALSRDIPAGPKEGPLPMPKASDSGTTPDKASDSSSSSGNIGTTELALIGGGIVVVGGIIALLIVLSRRRRSGQGQGPGGGAPYASYPGQPGPGQVPPHQYNPQQQPTSPGGYQSGPPTQPPGQ
ncbi:S8 family serine peptidase [Streptomyces sp. NPDC048639]|uniref:S8 family serine peptidase n=1 Tax=Streptomyces sp. NPDC048639 TaxID=3365581 RepID=UPI00371C4970